MKMFWGAFFLGMLTSPVLQFYFYEWGAIEDSREWKFKKFNSPICVDKDSKGLATGPILKWREGHGWTGIPEEQWNTSVPPISRSHCPMVKDMITGTVHKWRPGTGWIDSSDGEWKFGDECP